MWKWFESLYLPAHVIDQVHEHLWNYSQVNATEHIRWQVNIGSSNGFVLSGTRPLPEPMLTCDRSSPRSMLSYGVTRTQSVNYCVPIVQCQGMIWHANTYLFMFQICTLRVESCSMSCATGTWFNPSHHEFIFRKHKDIFAFCIISQHWDGTGD